MTYARWISEKTGKSYRLPSEAEWEYAARAGTDTAYWWGNDIGSNQANCDGCGGRWNRTKTSPVGAFDANAFGLYDMSGNVLEWVQDCWHDNYQRAPTDGSAWEGSNCALRVIRGGSWNFFAWNVRSAFRNSFPPSRRIYYLGFRLAQDL